MKFLVALDMSIYWERDLDHEEILRYVEKGSHPSWGDGRQLLRICLQLYVPSSTYKVDSTEFIVQMLGFSGQYQVNGSLFFFFFYLLFLSHDRTTCKLFFILFVTHYYFYCQALVSLAEEIAKSGIPKGSRKINGKYIQSHLHSRLEGMINLPCFFEWTTLSIVIKHCHFILYFHMMILSGETDEAYCRILKLHLDLGRNNERKGKCGNY